MSKVISESELKNMVIDDYVNQRYGKTYYITITENKEFRIHNKAPKKEHYKLIILWGFWEDQWHEYNYNYVYHDDTAKDETEEQKEKMFEDCINDKDGYRDYLSMAKDHLEINEYLKEIVF